MGLSLKRDFAVVMEAGSLGLTPGGGSGPWTNPGGGGGGRDVGESVCVGGGVGGVT